jgi:hypothetical protein
MRPGYNIGTGTPMDETPEELEKIRVEADAIDVHQYQRRFRALKAVGLGAAGAGLVWLVLILVDSRRNPCERVRDHLCRQQGKASLDCRMYETIMAESVEDENPQMRQSIRGQCQTKIERLKEEDGIVVR